MRIFRGHVPVWLGSQVDSRNVCGLPCLSTLTAYFPRPRRIFLGSILKKKAINCMESESNIRGRKCYSCCPLFDAKKRSGKLGRQGSAEKVDAEYPHSMGKNEHPSWLPWLHRNKQARFMKQRGRKNKECAPQPCNALDLEILAQFRVQVLKSITGI
jgi:hypothetical protein